MLRYSEKHKVDVKVSQCFSFVTRLVFDESESDWQRMQESNQWGEHQQTRWFYLFEDGKDGGALPILADGLPVGFQLFVVVI